MSSRWQRLRFGEFLRPNTRPHTLAAAEDANLVGMRLYGEGPFHRELKPAMTIAKKTHFVIRSGDVIYNKLFAWKGTFGVVPPVLDGMFVSDKFPTYHLDRSKVDERWLRWYFRCPPLWDEAKGMSTGSAALSKLTLNPPKFLLLTAPVPPLATQQLIVARIEALAAEIHEARGLRQEAVRGTDSILRSWLDAYVKEAFRRPGGSRAVGSFTTFDRYGPRFYNEPYSEDGTRIVRATDIDDRGHINFSKMPRLRVSAQDVAKLRILPGDLLIVRSGSIGLSAVFSKTDIECIPAAYLLQFRFDRTADSHYVRYCLQAPLIQRELTGRGTTVQNLNANKIKGTQIPFPTLSEQCRIVAYLEGLQKHTEALKALQAETSGELDALMPSILERAFRGEL